MGEPSSRTYIGATAQSIIDTFEENTALRAENTRLREAIERHEFQIRLLGTNADGLHGGSYDRELWAALHPTDQDQESR